MKIRLTNLLIILIIFLVFWLYWVIPPAPATQTNQPTELPKKPLTQKAAQKPLTPIQQKKRAFFEFMYPKIEQANLEIMQERAWIASHPYEENHPKWQRLIQSYAVKTQGKSADEIKQALLYKVLLIAPSMALAQAANESAWGTSRFAKQGNNYFGQWCFKKGCGIEPKQMDPKHYHAVKKFDSILDSVRTYMLNINAHRIYKPVRDIRWHLIKQAHKFPYGIYLVEGLINYSQRKEVYVRTLKSMIRHNKLQKYDDKLWEILKMQELTQ